MGMRVDESRPAALEEVVNDSLREFIVLVLL